MKAPKNDTAVAGTESNRGEIAEQIERFIKLTPEERSAEIRVTAEQVLSQGQMFATAIGEFSARAYRLAETASEIHGGEPEVQAATNLLIANCDFALALLMRDGPGLWAEMRAGKSDCSDLIVEMISQMWRTRFFLGALERDIANAKDKDGAVREHLTTYVSHVHQLVQKLNDLCEEYPNAADDAGAEFPNWPFLLFPRKSIPSSFHDIAAKVGLGTRCVIDASEAARYQWGSLNRYLFELLWEREGIRRQVTHRGDKSLKDFTIQLVSDFAFKPSPQEIQEASVFERSFDLKVLAKDRARAAEWADVLVMPIIDIREPDLTAKPAFAVACKHANNGERPALRTKLRTLVIDALVAMANPGS